MRLFYLLFLSFLPPLGLLGQTSPFMNPSFEGSYVGGEPNFWKNCQESSSTINLQPGFSDVYLPANEGKNYLGMVTRGGICETCNEATYQKLKYPLHQDSVYTFLMDLAHAPLYGGNRAQAILRIWGGNKDCKKNELLWVSPQQINDHWDTYSVQIKSCNTWDYIILEAYYRDPLHNVNAGNILMDNIRNFQATARDYILNLGKDTSLCRDNDLWLDIRFPSNFPNPIIRWNTGASSPRILADKSGKYWVSVFYDCTTQIDTIEVVQEKCVFIPNVFTPNQDGQNETFFIEGIQRGNWQLQIYDRKGTLVYENPAYQNNWTGYDLLNAVYYYYLINKDTKENYKGWVEIMR